MTKLGAHIYWPRVYLLSNKKRNVIMLAPSNYLKVHSQENGILSLTLAEQRLNAFTDSETKHSAQPGETPCFHVEFYSSLRLVKLN